jgi:hypothetical protein
VLVIAIVFAQWIGVHFRHGRRLDCQTARNGDVDLSASRPGSAGSVAIPEPEADVWVTNVTGKSPDHDARSVPASLVLIGFPVAVVCHPIT